MRPSSLLFVAHTQTHKHERREGEESLQKPNERAQKKLNDDNDNKNKIADEDDQCPTPAERERGRERRGRRHLQKRRRSRKQKRNCQTNKRSKREKKRRLKQLNALRKCETERESERKRERAQGEEETTKVNESETGVYRRTFDVREECAVRERAWGRAESRSTSVVAASERLCALSSSMRDPSRLNTSPLKTVQLLSPGEQRGRRTEGEEMSSSLLLRANPAQGALGVSGSKTRGKDSQKEEKKTKRVNDEEELRE